MIGSVAGTINNIGACILIGAVSGFISGFYLQVIHPRLNFKKAYDHLGIFGPILICSIIGGLVVSPAMYKTFMSKGVNTNALGSQITDSNLMLYQLIYIGVTAMVAAGSGMLAGLLAYRSRDC
jgi:ammonia channel protein AmtB